jgi:hypothetical protein
VITASVLCVALTVLRVSLLAIAASLVSGVASAATGKARCIVTTAFTNDSFPQQASWQPLP